MVNPVTVMGLDVPVFVMPPGLEITVYMMIGLPPSETGAPKLTVACPCPGDAVTAVGAPGNVPDPAGVTLFELAEAGPVPTAFAAVTVKV